MYELSYSKKVLNALKRFPANEQQRIRSKIADYATAPKAHTHQVKKLKGRDGYRLRVGKWRIIFAVNGNVLEVLEVGARGSVYD